MAIRKINKKGSILDMAYIGMIILVFAMLILVMFKVSNSFNTQIQDKDDMPDNAKQAVSRLNNAYPGVMDGSIVFFGVMLFIVAIALAALVKVHPIFFVPYLIVFVFIIILAATYSNVYDEMASSPQMADVADKLILTTLFLRALPITTFIFGGILAMMMYKSYNNDMAG